MSYIFNVGIGLTNALNAFFGGSPYESTSSHSWRERNNSRFWSVMQRSIDWGFECLGYPDHCQRAFETEEQRRCDLSPK